MRYESEFENEIPDLWPRDAEIADLVLCDEPRHRFVRLVNQFAWLADYCDSDIEAALCVGLCAVLLPDHPSNIRDYIWPQYKARPFRLDFVIWPTGSDRDRRIGIECDGAAYHSSERQRGKDAWRSRKIFELYGIPIIRFTGREIFADAKGCARRALSSGGSTAWHG